MTIQICTNCLLPSTKPDLTFNDEGVCSACQRYEERPTINWEEKKVELLDIVRSVKNDTNWDCVIPVSGGKDSTFQALYAKEIGLNPLLVSSTTCDLTEIGYHNIQNLQKLGFDHIQFSPRKDVRAKLNRFGLEQVGDISWPEHIAMFTLPITVAVRYKVPLILWGENPQHEYGAGDKKSSEAKVLDRQWLEEYGAMNGLRVSDVPNLTDICSNELFPYLSVTPEEIESIQLKSLFLGSFIPWNGLNNALIAQAHGMKTYGKCVEGSVVDYENIDNHQNGIHDYFKYLKFGFSRASDILSILIRRNLIGRDMALKLLEKHERRSFPHHHLGKNLSDILEPLNMSIDEFVSICDMYTNPEIFTTNADGSFVKFSDGTPVLKQSFLAAY